MKSLLVLVFVTAVKGDTITAGLTTTVGTELHKKVIGPIEENRSEDSKRRVAQFAKENGIELTVNTDDVLDETNFIRPCDFKDMKCIRKFMAKNSKCKPAYGPIIEPVYFAQNTEAIPFLNLTITCSNFTVEGLDSGEIIEYYYNIKTCKLVIAIKFKNLIEKAPYVYFSYQRNLKESVVLADKVNVYTKTMILTIIIPIIPDLKLKLAEVHAYIPDSNPLVEIGPNAYTSNDPDVQEAYAGLLSSLPIVLQERALFKSDLFAALFIQKKICDFGVKLYRL